MPCVGLERPVETALATKHSTASAWDALQFEGVWAWVEVEQKTAARLNRITRTAQFLENMAEPPGVQGSQPCTRGRGARPITQYEFSQTARGFCSSRCGCGAKTA